MKVNLKNLKNFKQGVKNITTEQQLNAVKYSGLGGCIGLSIALVAMVIALTRSWSWQTFGMSIFVFFFIPVQFNSYRSAKKQIEQLNKDRKEYQSFVGGK